jgi:hypothetical protein
MRMTITLRRTTYEYATVEIEMPDDLYDLDAFVFGITEQAMIDADNFTLDWDEHNVGVYIDTVELVNDRDELLYTLED